MIFPVSHEESSLIAEKEAQIFDHPWSESQINEHLASGNPIWADRMENGEIRGYLIVCESFGDWEIFRIAVDPQFQRTGTAGRLIAELESCCSPDSKIFLEVRADNLPARSLYEACGFEECGRRKKYYSDGEDAVLMMKSFEKSDILA